MRFFTEEQYEKRLAEAREKGAREASEWRERLDMDRNLREMIEAATNEIRFTLNEHKEKLEHLEKCIADLQGESGVLKKAEPTASETPVREYKVGRRNLEG